HPADHGRREQEAELRVGELEEALHVERGHRPRAPEASKRDERRPHRPHGGTVCPYGSVIRRIRVVAVALVVAVVAAGCSSSGSTASSSSIAAGKPGDIVSTAPFAAPGLHGTAVRVEYHSQSVAGDDIVVSGVVAYPDPSVAAPQ